MNISAIPIGLVVADTMEYKPFLDVEGESGTCFGMPMRILRLPGDKPVEVRIVQSGIGKVNAAAATAFLVAGGARMILNCGLAGGLGGPVRRGDFVLGAHTVEYDFDLTGFGYLPGQKPDQAHMVPGDARLLRAFTAACEAHGVTALPGCIVSGDRFVSETSARDRLTAAFGALACDMESAACANICHRADIPFLAVRRISDGADEAAAAAYTDMNQTAGACLRDVVFWGINQLTMDN